MDQNDGSNILTGVSGVKVLLDSNEEALLAAIDPGKSGQKEKWYAIKWQGEGSMDDPPIKSQE